MSNTITIREQQYQLWKTGTYLAAVLSLVFGLIFWNLTNPFWVGIFRLLAFVFFSLAVFGVLKRLGGPLKIIINATPEYLTIEYQQKDKIVQQEQFERSTIEGFQPSENKQERWLSSVISSPSSQTLVICFNDQAHNLPLFEYSGRTLFFSQSTIQEVESYLDKENIVAQSQEMNEVD